MSIYTEAEQYIIDCLSVNKKPNGRKIKILKEQSEQIRYQKIYNDFHKIETPVCPVCKYKFRAFISISAGYRNYCSFECRKKDLSEYNKKNNKLKNQKKSHNLEQQRLETLKKAAEYYINNKTTTLRQTADKFKLPYGALRKYASDNDIADKSRSRTIYTFNLIDKFSSINQQLKDSIWIQDKLKDGWTSKTFAQYLNCSPNYVVSFLREQGNPLPIRSCSHHEKVIEQWLRSLGIEVITNTRKIISPKELDLFLPEYNLAIEVNGIYWHNTDVLTKDYHIQKTKLCNDRGIKLLHFYDSEIENRFELVKSIISSCLGNNKTIYARNCEVQELVNKTYRQFLKENHIQGSIAASVKYGLFYQEQLVSVISFGKSRYNKNYQFELLRYCNLSGFNVLGGAGKLFKHFIIQHNPSSIVSYCQRRLFDGKMYQKLGMELLRETSPNYFWVDKYNNQFTRYQTQKHLIKESESDIRTETEIMKQRGFYKIYDSGQLVYYWSQ